MGEAVSIGQFLKDAAAARSGLRSILGLSDPAAGKGDQVARALANQGLPANSIPFAYRVDPSLFSKFTAKLAAVAAGVGRCKVAIVGDSTVAGEGGGSGGGSNLTNAYASAWPARFTSLLQARGISTTHASRFGDGGNQRFGTGLGTYDARVTMGTGWVPDTTLLDTVGGSPIKCTGTGVMAFTPTEQFDTCDIYYVTFPGHGSINANLDGGANTLINASQASAIRKTTITGTLGAHTVNLTGVSGTVYLVGIDCYNAASPQVSVWNFGRRGGKTTDFIPATNSAWIASNVFPVIQPDFTIYGLGINDSFSSVSPTDTTTAVSTAIDLARQTGDIAIVTQLPANVANITLDKQEGTVAAVRALAVTKNVPMFDLYARRGSYAASSPLGHYWDWVHQTKQGYADVARFVDRALVHGT